MRYNFDFEISIDSDINDYFQDYNANHIVSIFQSAGLSYTPDNLNVSLLKFLYLHGDSRTVFTDEENEIIEVYNQFELINYSRDEGFQVWYVTSNISVEDHEYYALGLHKIIEKAFRCNVLLIYRFSNVHIVTITLNEDYELGVSVIASNPMSNSLFRTIIQFAINSFISNVVVKDVFDDIIYFLLNAGYLVESHVYQYRRICFGRYASLKEIINEIDLENVNEVTYSRLSHDLYTNKIKSIKHTLNELQPIISSSYYELDYVSDTDVLVEDDDEMGEEYSLENTVQEKENLDEIDKIIDSNYIDFEDPEELLRFFN